MTSSVGYPQTSPF